LYDPTLEVTNCCCGTKHVLQVALRINCKMDSGKCWYFHGQLSLLLLCVDCQHHIVIAVIVIVAIDVVDIDDENIDIIDTES